MPPPPPQALALAWPALAKEVAVDVGHYAAEPGVISASGVPEFEYNLALALQLKTELENFESTFALIGERGDYAVLYDRTARRAGHGPVRLDPPRFGQGEPAAAGGPVLGVFAVRFRENPKLGQSLACASAIGAQLRSAGFTPSRYHADPVTGRAAALADEANGVHYYDNLAVARTATMPSVLVEAGVIVNHEEERRMRDPQVRARIAAAVAAGVRACLAKET